MSSSTRMLKASLAVVSVCCVLAVTVLFAVKTSAYFDYPAANTNTYHLT